jgi:uncharacterized protein YidB (DUF937 family)
MSLLNSVLSAVLGGAGQSGGASAGGNLGALLPVITSMLSNDGQQGGLGGLMDKFNQAGMGDVIGSWIGKGENSPISADQLSQVLGSGALGDIASKLGMSQGDAGGALAQMLPSIIDQLTPNGQAPEGGLGGAGDLMGMLGKMLQK